MLAILPTEGDADKHYVLYRWISSSNEDSKNCVYQLPSNYACMSIFLCYNLEKKMVIFGHCVLVPMEF